MMSQIFSLSMPYYNGDAVIIVDRYRNNNAVAWKIQSPRGEPLFTATVNLDSPAPEGFIFLKSYGENTGLLEALVAAGFIQDTGYRLAAGYEEAAMVKVVPEAFETALAA